MMRWLLAVGALLVAAGAAAQQPVLRYEPPPDFYRSAISPPDDYSAKAFNAGVQVYPFRRFNGSIEQVFRSTLLRDWIEPRFREANLAAPAEFRAVNVAGAQAAFSARFAENVGTGMPRQHMRMVIVSGNAAAIVDASASSPEIWQRALPALNALAATLKVTAGAPPPDVAKGPGTAGKAVAGLYVGNKAKYVVDLNRPAGYGRQVAALHYYLFSADGNVYRAYDDLKVPAGDPARFDFAAARRADPENSGRYTVADERLHITIGSETISTGLPKGSNVTINTIQYVKQ